nr:MAG TPA: hypothetical protein [Caudoviricetes sp.]
MIKITFEGTTDDVMKEMKEFIDNSAEGGVVEVPKNWTTQDVPPEEPKQEEAAKAEAVTVAPTAPVKEYKLEELQVAMQPLINSKLSELQALLAKYGVPSLVELPKERYPEFAADLRAMGVQI